VVSATERAYRRIEDIPDLLVRGKIVEKWLPKYVIKRYFARLEHVKEVAPGSREHL
jgi:hypothetical protein